MIKTLTRVGSSLALIIERPILNLLDINRETLLEIKTDGQSLTIRPIRETPAEQEQKAAKKG